MMDILVVGRKVPLGFAFGAWRPVHVEALHGSLEYFGGRFKSMYVQFK